VIILVLGGILTVGVVGGAITVAVVSRNLPSLEELTTRQVAQSTKIYDRTGTHLLYETYGDQKRTVVPLDKIATFAQKATISIEDKDFYQHHGIRVQSIIRAEFNNLIGRKTGAGGASTLTQQLVKNALVGNERSLLRKIKEALLALELEKHYTKDQILTMYLNEISYGSTNYGIESAAHSYFNKTAAELTLAESAALAAMLPQPSYYLRNMDALRSRRDTVLRLMQGQGYITEQEKTDAQKVELKFDRALGIANAPHFVVYVQRLLNDQFGERVVDTSGFKVITTLDFDKQLAAQKIVKENGDTFAKNYNANNAALVAIDPKNGQILAHVGSRDFYNKDINGQFDVISDGRRQPGSSLKPLVYLAAFERGFTPNTVLYDVKTDFNLSSSTKSFAPKNANGKEYGLITMRSALQGSLNIPAVKTMYLVGYQDTIDFVKRFGYTTFTGDFGLSLVLGGGEVNPLEHTAAYATLANSGLRNPTTAILRIENDKGETVFQWQTSTPQVAVSKDLASTISNILSDNQARAYIFGLKNNLTLPDRPVAVKTGTTQNNADAWTVGYVPSLATGVWVGNTDNTPTKAGGEKLAGLIWNQFMRAAVSGTPVEKFPNLPTTTPPDKPVLNGSNAGIKIKINSLTGRIAVTTTPTQLVVEQTFLPPHDILHYVNRLDPTGPMPANPSEDGQYQNWENALQDWVNRQNLAGKPVTLTDPPTQFDTQDPALAPTISITTPTDHQVFSTRALHFEVAASAPRGVHQVDYQIDGASVGTSQTAPFSLDFYAHTLSKGDRVLTVVALDDLGNNTSAHVNFTLDAELDPPSAAWFGSSTLTLAASDFPRAIYLTPFRWSDIKQIEIYLTLPTGERKLIYTFNSKSELFGNNLILTWNHSPGIGQSTLTAVVTAKDGNETQTDLAVTVK
jgi:penicillin-binding protein 1C